MKDSPLDYVPCRVLKGFCPDNINHKCICNKPYTKEEKEKILKERQSQKL